MQRAFYLYDYAMEFGPALIVEMHPELLALSQRAAAAFVVDVQYRSLDLQVRRMLKTQYHAQALLA